jgi:hypothetical protein
MQPQPAGIRPNLRWRKEATAGQAVPHLYVTVMSPEATAVTIVNPVANCTS